MSQLAETLSEPVGKPVYAMARFFDSLVKSGELVAFDVEVDRKVVKKDTDAEKIVMTIKGASLTQTNEIRDNRSYIIDRKNQEYHLDTESHGSMFYDDGDSQTIYHSTVLERLAQNFDLRKVLKSGDYFGIWVPSEMVDGILRVGYDEDWENDRVAETRGHLRIDGERDELFDKVCEFVLKKK